MDKKESMSTASKALMTVLCILAVANIILMAVFANRINSSAGNTTNIQSGPTIVSTGKIKTKDSKVVIDTKDLQNLSDAITNNANILQETKETAAITIDGFTSTGNSHTISNEAIKGAKSVQVNYADENYDIVPMYSVDAEAGKLTISNIKDGIVVRNIIVFH